MSKIKRLLSRWWCGWAHGHAGMTPVEPKGWECKKCGKVEFYD